MGLFSRSAEIDDLRQEINRLKSSIGQKPIPVQYNTMTDAINENIKKQSVELITRQQNCITQFNKVVNDMKDKFKTEFTGTVQSYTGEFKIAHRIENSEGTYNNFDDYMSHKDNSCHVTFFGGTLTFCRQPYIANVCTYKFSDIRRKFESEVVAEMNLDPSKVSFELKTDYIFKHDLM